MIKRKYFKKIFLILLFLAIVYSLAIGGYFIYQSYSNAKKQQVQYSKDAASQISTTIDQRLWSLDNYINTLYFNEYIRKYSITKMDYYAITRLHNKLRLDMAVFSDIGARLAVTKMVDGLVVSNQSTRSIPMFFNEMGISDKNRQAIEDYFYQEESRRQPLIIMVPVLQSVMVIHKNEVSKDKDLLVIASIDEEMIQNSFRRGQVDFELKKISEISHTIKGDQFIQTLPSEVYDDLVFNISLPYETDYFSLREYLLNFLVVFALSILSLLIARLLTGSLYKPVDQMINHLASDEKEADDEFLYIETKTKDMEARNDQLKAIISNNKMDLKKKHLRELLLGIASVEDVTKHGLNIYPFESGLRVIYTYIEELDDYRDEVTVEIRSKVRQQIYQHMDQVLDLTGKQYELVEIEYDAFAIIIENNQETYLYNLLNKILKAIDLEENINLIFGIGETTDSLNEVNKGYQSAKTAIELRRSYDKRAILSIDDYKDKEEGVGFYYPLDLERELITATVNGAKERIDKCFTLIMERNFEEVTLGDRDLLNLIDSLSNSLRRIEQKIDLEADIKQQIHLEMLSSKWQEKCYENMEQIQNIFINYARFAEEKSISKDKELMTLMISFVEMNYNKDISLEDASTYLNISAGYFSTIFKELTGENFKTYLNQYRVKVAKERLASDNSVKVKDLAREVGYNNANSFIRMFKKYVGVSPGVYAKQMK